MSALPHQQGSGIRDQGSASPLPAPRSPFPDWVPLATVEECLAAAGTPLTERRLRQIAVSLRAAGQARQLRGAWHFARTAAIAGTALSSLLSPLASPSTFSGYALPPGAETWSNADRRRFEATVLLLRAWDKFRATHARTPVEQLGPRFAASTFPPSVDPAAPAGLTVAAWCTLDGRNLRCDVRRLRDYAARLRIDGNVDRRGRTCGTGLQPVSEEAWDFFKRLYLAPQRRTIALCYELAAHEAQQRGWAWPSLAAVRRRVKVELPSFTADYHRLGPRRWGHAHEPRIERDLSLLAPNEVWIGDHALFDFLALDPRTGKPCRLWLTSWMCQRSRFLPGWQITTGPNSDTILAALKHGILEHGAPRRLYIDNGKDYRAAGVTGGKKLLDAQRVQSVCGRLEIEARFARPLAPHVKAIESFHRTLHEGFDKLFDSYCGNAPDTRPEDFYRRLAADGLYVPTLAEVCERFGLWLQHYHSRPHAGDGMDGRCPAEVFADNPIARRTAPADVLCEMLKRTVQVTVTRRGVRWRGVNYGQDCKELWQRQGQTVALALDPDAGDSVTVRDLEGRFICVATNARLRGTTQADLKEAARRRKEARRIAQKALPAARLAQQSVADVAADMHRATTAEQAQQQRATGTDQHRPMQLIPAAAHLTPPPAAPQYRPPVIDVSALPTSAARPAPGRDVAALVNLLGNYAREQAEDARRE